MLGDTIENPKPYVCKLCKQKEGARYMGNRRMITKELCFHCNFWDEYVAKKDDPHIARVDGKHYWINPMSNESRALCGFSGHLFRVEWFDGRKAESNDVWYQGTIPEHFRELLPDNAKFIS